MARFKVKGKGAFLVDCLIYLIIGLILFGIEKLVQHFWVHSLFSRGIGALFMVYVIAAALGVFLNFVGSFGDVVGFIGFCIGTTASLVFLAVNLSYGVSHHSMFNVVSCVCVPIILYGYFSDHYVKNAATHTTTSVTTSTFVCLILVLALGIADACIKKSGVSLTITSVILAVLFVILLAVWIPRFVKQKTLPFSNNVTYVEEDENSVLYHVDFPERASIQECRNIIASAIKNNHMTRGLGEFVADYQVQAPFTDMIVINLWYKEKDSKKKSTSAYYRSRNKLSARLRAMAEDCPYKVTWDVRDVDGNFYEYLSPTDY